MRNSSILKLVCLFALMSFSYSQYFCVDSEDCFANQICDENICSYQPVDIFFETDDALLSLQGGSKSCTKPSDCNGGRVCFKGYCQFKNLLLALFNDHPNFDFAQGIVKDVNAKIDPFGNFQN
ncbi:UNKNOWN [Stylonychia lemnae]|uniref:Dickkopf N-terminal cysteine-rich domain-containing protein n=1 Tax=Stylonychia lemnae TaxID=5949 RepID=A0A078AQZ3_STYLE|nr:UNKNOWN [Stylonychia lemnae]|eukprot:CDW84639.1 UNKNOWN [Stylonychia lemnae]